MLSSASLFIKIKEQTYDAAEHTSVPHAFKYSEDIEHWDSDNALIVNYSLGP